MTISFTVRRSDIVWMYLGSWGMWIAVTPGLALLAIGLSGTVPPAIGLPSTSTVPITNYMFFLVFGLIGLVAGPAYLCFVLWNVNRMVDVVDVAVTLQIDGQGVWGWPLADDIDTSWSQIRGARRLGGVTTLPFHDSGTRRGWIPIPDRAFSPEQRKVLHDILAAKEPV